MVYSATNRISNQLATLEHIGLLDKPLGKEFREGVTKASDPTPGDESPTGTPTTGTTTTRAQEAAEEAEQNGLCA